MESSTDRIVDVPIELRFSENSSRPVAVIGLGDAISQSKMALRLRDVEDECEQTIKACNSIMRQASSRNSNALLRWEIGNLVLNFLKTQKEHGFIILNHVDTFARGLGIAKSYLEAILRFRERYPDKSLIRSNITWGKYYELVWFNNLSVMRKIEKQLVSGEVRSNKAIQEIRKKANERPISEIDSKIQLPLAREAES